MSVRFLYIFIEEYAKLDVFLFDTCPTGPVSWNGNFLYTDSCNCAWKLLWANENFGISKVNLYQHADWVISHASMSSVFRSKTRSKF